nr:hypothetical protein CFP56_70303 [Quercus suber]
MNHWEKRDDHTLLLNMKKEVIMGYQCSMVVEKRYLPTKAKLEELAKDNEDLLGKISDVMNEVSESENTKAIIERKEALKKNL